MEFRNVPSSRDHPRMCGDHQHTDSLEAATRGSPPHVRGPPTSSSGQENEERITPACAGTTQKHPEVLDNAKDHPRMCGDHWRPMDRLAPSRGSPPHVRGPLGITSATTTEKGITPACAGTTLTFDKAVMSHGDHPRMCGDHWGEAVEPKTITGSPPHVRGPRRPCADAYPLSRITPACAGTTNR